MLKNFLITGSISGAIGVLLGATGAHILRSKVEDGILLQYNLDVFETAVRYQIIHSLLLIILYILSFYIKSKLLSWAGWSLSLGIILFSGSLYLLSLSPLTELNLRWLGPLTPVGGLMLVMGWIFIALSGFKRAE